MIVNFRRFTALFALASAPCIGADWPAYLFDLAHSSFNRNETILNSTTAGTLEPAWSAKLYAPIVAGATVVDGVLYVGEWAGNFYALDVKTGNPKWWTFVGKAPNPAASNCQQGIGVSGQAVVSGDVVYVAGGDSSVYALDKASGAQVWRLQLADPTSGSYLWTSLTIHGNALYAGISSLGDCPLVRGALVRIDLARPHQPLYRWLAPEVPKDDDDIGGGVWSTPAIDTATNTLYVTTGTGNQDPERGMWGGTLLAMDAATLEIKNHFFLPTNSLDEDIEWGSSAMLFETSTGVPMVAATGKDGLLYARRREDLEPAWVVTLALSCVCPECGCGSLSTPAFDGTRLYVGAGAPPDADLENGSIYAIDPDNGEILWRNLLQSAVIAPVTVANGVVFVSTMSGLEVFEAETGNELWRGPETMLFSQPVVVDGVVYTTQVNGLVVAWKPAQESVTSQSARPGPPTRRRALLDRSSGNFAHLP